MFSDSDIGWGGRLKHFALQHFTLSPISVFFGINNDTLLIFTHDGQINFASKNNITLFLYTFNVKNERNFSSFDF